MTCPSNYIRNRLAQETDAPPDQIHVIPWGADDLDGGLIDAETESCVLNKYRVTSPFVLHLGATQNHKNTRRLIEAWAYLRRRTRRQWRLLVLGLDATAQRDLLKNCQLEGVQSSVLLQGFANGEETRILISAAEVLAHPSLAEGFGGPVLEAFAAGTAVLTGNRTSLPEIAGDAALLVDPEDRLDMTRGLNRLIQQPNLRSSLAQRGSAQLQHFPWHSSAEAFGRLFNSVIA